MALLRSRYRRGGRFWGLGTTLAAIGVALLFVAIAGGAPKPPPPTPFPVPVGPIGHAASFEDNDANMPANASGDAQSKDTSTINYDWNNIAPVTWRGNAPYQNTNHADGTPVISAAGWQFLGLTDDQKSTTDTGFAGGVKQDDNCAVVQGGSAPNKDDLKRIYIASKIVNSHVYLELAWVRISQNTPSPSAHVAFEFNQNGATNACGTSSPGLVQRKAGDMLIVYDFTGGSVPPTLNLSRWLGANSNLACQVGSHTPPCWGVQTTLPATVAEANVDTGLTHACTTGDPLTDPNCGPNEKANTSYATPGSTSDALSPAATTNTPDTAATSEFGEAGIDLTNAGVFDNTHCTSFGQVLAVSRSSGDSSTAAMEDLVGPGSFTLSNCGEIKIIKVTDPANQDKVFPFNTNIKSNGGSDQSCSIAITAGTPDTFNLNGKDDTTTTTVNETTEDCTNLLPSGGTVANYTIGEGTEPTGYSYTKVVCSSANSTSTITPTATSGTPNTTAPGNETITLAPEDVVTCTYTNTKNKANPGATSAPSLIPNDTVTVSNLDTTGSASGGADQKMTVTLYSDADTDCTSTGTAKLFSQTFTVDANKGYPTTNDGDSSNQTLKGYTISGDQTSKVYHWGIVYDGDTRNNGFNYCSTTVNQTTTFDENITVSIHGKS